MTRTYTHDVEVQFRDLDTRGHVNHVVYASYFEQAKGAFYRDVLGRALVDTPTVVRSLDVDYRAPIEPDRTATVTVGPVAVGESSLTVEYDLAVEDALAATGRTVSVYLDEDGRPASIPDDWRERLAPYAAADTGR